jgi:hypothetical protein
MANAFSVRTILCALRLALFTMTNRKNVMEVNKGEAFLED